MKILLIIYFFLFTGSALATDGREIINTQSELRIWCKNKSSEHFFQKGISPYNWTASSWINGSTLKTKGNWRINNSNQIVNCRILKGSLVKYMIVEMPSQVTAATRYDEETPTHTSGDLREWCKSKSAQYYIKKNTEPYNWTSTQWEKDKVLYVKGNWRVNNSTKIINCTNKKGVAEKYATIKFTDR